jgi:hypothetical protein
MWKTGKVFADGIEDPAIKIQLLLLGREKTVNEALRQILQETLADTRNDLQEELSLILQAKAQTTKAEIRINQERM